MKNKIHFLLLTTFLFIIYGCDKGKTEVVPTQTPTDLINNQFPESQAEIQSVLDGIFKSIQDGDADKLISYHIYGPKFTEFRDSERRFNSADNEQYERGFVGAISGFDYELGDLKINVFGDLAVVTFHADFRPTIGEDVPQIWGSTTLVFVKVDNEWKITHEHHSPLNVE
jgi:ketosteroid isomerase-like protein